MKRTLIALFLTAGTALALTAAPADDIARCKKAMSRTMEKLMLISDTIDTKSPAEAAAIAKILEDTDAKLAKYAPSKDSDTLSDRMKTLIIKSKEGSAKGSLSSLRSAIMVYFGDHEGEYPSDISKLVPDYIAEVPSMEIPGHKETNEVRVVTKAAGKSFTPYIKDTGKWLYFYVPDNADLNGWLIIDCSHKDSRGETWFKY